MSNIRVYTLFFTYLAKAWHTLLFREIHPRGEQPHDETAGQIRPDGVEPEPPPTHKWVSHKVTKRTWAIQLFLHRDGQWCNKNGEHLLEDELLLLPELSGLIWGLGSANVFGGRPSLSDWVLMTMNWKVIYLRTYTQLSITSQIGPHCTGWQLAWIKAKVMFLVASGISGKQPKITINGTELKAISNSHCLCSLLSNDRSSALLFCGSLSNHQ